jgi:hypothetical protein
MFGCSIFTSAQIRLAAHPPSFSHPRYLLSGMGVKDHIFSRPEILPMKKSQILSST